jgi:hypothetical protein
MLGALFDGVEDVAYEGHAEPRVVNTYSQHFSKICWFEA